MARTTTDKLRYNVGRQLRTIQTTRENISVCEVTWKCIDFKCHRKPTKSRLGRTLQANRSSSRWAE